MHGRATPSPLSPTLFVLAVLSLLFLGCSETPRNGMADSGSRDGTASQDAVADTIEADSGPPIPGLGVSKAALVDFLGGREGVLVWVAGADQQPQMLDFREDDPQVVSIAGEDGWQNPLVSPDGTRVVYADRTPTPRTIYVKQLSGAAPQEIAPGDVGYWQVREGQEQIVYCDESSKHENGADGKTYGQPLTTGGIALAGAAEEIHDRAMDGGPNGAGSWLGQVYNNLYAFNRETRKEYTYDQHFLLMDGTAADHQSCNGSMSPDGTPRLMSLVIPHDYVRIYSYSDEDDNFQESSRLLLPEGMAEWEYPEWSTDAGFFTAILMKSDRKHRLVIVKVAEGEIAPQTLEVSGDPLSAPDGITYSHLYVE